MYRTVAATEVDNKEKADCISNLSAQANLSRSFLARVLVPILFSLIYLSVLSKRHLKETSRLSISSTTNLVLEPLLLSSSAAFSELG